MVNIKHISVFIDFEGLEQLNAIYMTTANSSGWMLAFKFWNIEGKVENNYIILNNCCVNGSCNFVRNTMPELVNSDFISNEANLDYILYFLKDKDLQYFITQKSIAVNELPAKLP
jgi:hypothetical protein